MKNLEFVKIARDLIFRASISEGLWIALSAGRQIRVPQYSSWAGFNGWFNTVVESIEIDPKVLNLALRDPEADYSWLEEIPESDLEDMADYSPFVHDIPLEILKQWYFKYRHMGFSFKKFVHNHEHICALGVDSRQFLYAERLTEIFQESSERLAAIAGWHRRPALEVRAELMGCPLSLAEMKLSQLYMLRNLVGEIDLEYYNRTLALDDLIRAGVRPITLCHPLEVTKAEASHYVRSFTEKGSPGLHNFKLFALEFFIRRRHPEIPRAWLHHLRSLKVAGWAARHIAQLSKVRRIHGPGGQIAELHMHELLEHVTEDMLTQGSKTAWRKIEADLEEISRRKIADQFTHDRPLARLPKPYGRQFPMVRQITSTHELRDEGVRMNHCVGGYIQACLARRSYIFHVEDGTEKGATVEVCPNPWRVVQAMGEDNTPSEKARQIMERYIKNLP